MGVTVSMESGFRGGMWQSGSVFHIDSNNHLSAYYSLEEGVVVCPLIRWNVDGSIQFWSDGVQRELIETDPAQIWCPLLQVCPKYFVPLVVSPHYYIRKI